MRSKRRAGLILAAAVASSATAQDTTVLDGVFTSEQAARGAGVYEANCKTCHGTTLKGTPFGPSLVGDKFNIAWTGGTVGDMYTFIYDNMPAGRRRSLSAEEYADVLALILSRQGYPAGGAELVPDPAALGAIEIVEAP
jgi:quinoprotein glucose dehydrogenase